MNSNGKERSRSCRFRFISCVCLGLAISGGFVSVARAAVLPMADPLAQSSSTPGLSPVILSPGWAIRYVETNDLGSVAFIGGGHYYGDDYLSGGIADGAVLVTSEGIDKFAALGDPVPDRPGRVFAGFASKSLNNHDEIAFVALTLPAGDSTNCLEISWPSNCLLGVNLYSGGHVRGIAQAGDVAPDTGGLTFTGFGWSAQLNDQGMIAFQAGLSGSDGVQVTGGFFLFDGNNTHKIVLTGEDLPQLGLIGELPAPFFFGSDGVLTFCTNGVVAQYADGKFTKVLAAGEPSPGGGTVPEFDQLVSISGNKEGDVVFETHGVPYENSRIYLVRRDGQVNLILAQGDPAPGGGKFSLTYTVYWYHIPVTYLSDLNPQINDAGEVVFVTSVSGGTAAAGIFLYSDGQLSALVVNGEPLPSDPGRMIVLLYDDGYSVYSLLNEISFGPLGEVVFTAYKARDLGDISSIAIFRKDEGSIHSLVVNWDPAPGSGGQFANSFLPFVATNGLGDVVFLSNLSGSSYVRGLFRVSPLSPDVPNAGFEAATKDGLPEHWTTTWTNFGKGSAWDYDTDGRDSLEGNSNLRLEVAPSGGAVFIVSDPIPVSSDADYFLQSRMRYNLSGSSDSVYFTVIQSDSNGNTVGLEETMGVQGDNFWTWQPRRLLFHTTPNAAVIRIRFGLIASTESVVDIDAVGGR